MERALVDGSVAEKADHRLRKTPHCHGVGDAQGDRAGLADDGVSAHEAPLAVEHVHRAAHPAAHAGRTAEQLGHDVASRRSARQSMRVLAIGADDVIGRPGRVDDARTDRLLAGVEMEKADDIALRILFCGPLLEGS